jgi:hypothetical protein
LPIRKNNHFFSLQESQHEDEKTKERSLDGPLAAENDFLLITKSALIASARFYAKRHLFTDIF